MKYLIIKGEIFSKYFVIFLIAVTCLQKKQTFPTDVNLNQLLSKSGYWDTIPFMSLRKSCFWDRKYFSAVNVSPQA